MNSENYNRHIKSEIQIQISQLKLSNEAIWKCQDLDSFKTAFMLIIEIWLGN